jgi:pimeloyl-ACP methyl ester carboxylesterase
MSISYEGGNSNIVILSPESSQDVPLDFLSHESPRDIVFIHGAGESYLLWEPLLRSLAGEQKAYAVNLPGHPTGEITCRSIQEYAEAVHAFIRDGDIRKPVVSGHSMGGAIALTLVLEHKDDVSKLVLFDTGAELGVLPEILLGLVGAPLNIIERVITPKSFYKLDPELARVARRGLSLSNPAVFRNDYNACNEFDVRQRLSEISVETLIVCGENDELTPPKWSHYLNSKILNSILFFVRGAGHMAPIEKPDTCARLVSDFLSP